MKRFTKLTTAIALLLATTTSVQAAIESFIPDDRGVGSIAGGPSGPFTVNISKEYRALGAMTLEFRVDSGSTYLLSEDILNNTGLDWLDFHWEVIEEFGNVSIINVIGTGPFANINPLPDTAVWLDGGVLAPGQVMVTQIELNVANPTGGLFLLTQYPSVPLPGAIWLLASGLAATGVMRRRVRRWPEGLA